MIMATEQMSTADERVWEQLVREWDSAYRFTYDPDKEEPFIARRVDNNKAILSARDPEALYKRVRRDYFERPVPRSEAS